MAIFHEKEIRHIFGILWFLGAWFCFALNAALSKLLKETSSVATILLFQNCIGFLLILPLLLIRGVKLLKTDHPYLIFSRALVAFLAISGIFLASQRMPITDAMLLTNLSPFFVPFIVWIFLKKPINHKLWIGISIGLIGIIFILRPGIKIFNEGDIYGIGSALMVAFSTVLLRVLANKKVPVSTILFYLFLICALLSIPLGIIYWVKPTKENILILIVTGFIFAFAQFSFANALRHAKATHLGPFNYSAIVFGAVFDWLFFHNVPKLTTLIGILLVGTGGTLTFLLTKPPHNPPPKTHKH